VGGGGRASPASNFTVQAAGVRCHLTTSSLSPSLTPPRAPTSRPATPNTVYPTPGVYQHDAKLGGIDRTSIPPGVPAGFRNPSLCWAGFAPANLGSPTWPLVWSIASKRKWGWSLACRSAPEPGPRHLDLQFRKRISTSCPTASTWCRRDRRRSLRSRPMPTAP